MAKIQKAAILIHNAQFDSSMMEHIHTPEEHLLAVFSPLLLPLALPMLIGMVREWKRYKTLKLKGDPTGNQKEKVHTE